ncbi:hypothetical protein LSTR_LSTR016222 [Laodelphax striatellus]|uniref:Uncharacterized protein n=1 Tax=Laodelphax striatellus TaxID=195883 RepID=A0A482WT01_LAOST|nr:hypothetical protein LSTR_LSTR016222 [Laodelphax striatellus]
MLDKKTGKWNAMHVRIAWEIYHHQQKQAAEAKAVTKTKQLLGASANARFRRPSAREAVPPPSGAPGRACRHRLQVTGGPRRRSTHRRLIRRLGGTVYLAGIRLRLFLHCIPPFHMLRCMTPGQGKKIELTPNEFNLHAEKCKPSVVSTNRCTP